MIKDLPDNLIESMKYLSIWSEDCPVHIDNLSLIEIKYHDFSEDIKTGNMVVLENVANNVLLIFEELFKLKFPINTIETIDKFSGNDDKSMAANNSSCFNYRKIANSNILSMHSYGLAIDLNPLQNPYIIIDHKKEELAVFPKAGINFLNRKNQKKGMVEPIVEIFADYGFSEWGGNWDDPIDYHHFQWPRADLSNILKN